MVPRAPPGGFPPPLRAIAVPALFWRGSIAALAGHEPTALWLVVASLLLWRGGGGSARGGGFGRACYTGGGGGGFFCGHQPPPPDTVFFLKKIHRKTPDKK